MTLNINKLSPLCQKKNTLRFCFNAANVCMLNIGYNIFIMFKLADFYLKCEK